MESERSLVVCVINTHIVWDEQVWCEMEYYLAADKEWVSVRQDKHISIVCFDVKYIQARLTA